MPSPWLSIFSSLFIALNILSRQVSASSSYSEQLYLRPLPQSGLFASFEFHTNASLSSFEQQDFRYLPRSLSQILQYSHTQELHLRFGSGRWDEEVWGPLPRNGARVGGTGVELWAWVEADSSDEAYDNWLTLTNTLSGLFCASLNFIDSTRTIRPVAVFPCEGSHLNSTAKLHLMHGQLAREVVCTENLTPFLKLMPCKGKAGISSLLDGHKLFDSAWQSMSVDIRPVCPSDGTECAVEMDQMIDMVLDIERSKRPRDDPIPRPVEVSQLSCDQDKGYSQYGDACYPTPSESFVGFTVSEVFGRSLKGTCPLTEVDGHIPPTLCVDTSASPNMQPMTLGEYSQVGKDPSRTCYKMPVGADFDLAMAPQSFSFLPLPLLAPIKVYRTFSGRGQERGGSTTLFTNPSSAHAVDLIYLESLPWFIKPYLHTLAVTHQNSTSSATTTSQASPLLSNLHYVPAVDRHRGTHLELSLTIPAASTLALSYDFDKAILRYTEYPPDPNRGFDVPPAIVRVLPSEVIDEATGTKTLTPEYHVRTMSLLVYLPTPDFSMPYNVIILTSTVIALAFGSIFNILVRRFVGVDEVEGVGGGVLKVAVVGALRKLKTILRRGKNKTE